MTGVDDRLRRRVAELDAADAERHEPPGGLWDRIAASIEHDGVERPATVEYTIDRHDVVVAVGGEWDRAARAGEARELVALSTRPRLWDAIGDPELQDLWRAVVSRVRSSGHALDVEFRCDGPDQRRWFRMTLTPLADHSVHFRSEPTFEMDRPSVAALGRHTHRDPELERFVVCSWCAEGAAAADSGGEDRGDWLPIEELLARHRLLERQPAPPVSYGICPRCVQQMDGLRSDQQAATA